MGGLIWTVLLPPTYFVGLGDKELRCSPFLRERPISLNGLGIKERARGVGVFSELFTKGSFDPSSVVRARGVGVSKFSTYGSSESESLRISATRVFCQDTPLAACVSPTCS